MDRPTLSRPMLMRANPHAAFRRSCLSSVPPVNHLPTSVNLTISLRLKRRMGGPQVPVPLLT